MAINAEERQIIIDCLKFSVGTLAAKIEEMDQLISETDKEILFTRIDKIESLIFKIEKP